MLFLVDIRDGKFHNPLGQAILKANAVDFKVTFESWVLFSAVIQRFGRKTEVDFRSENRLFLNRP